MVASLQRGMAKKHGKFSLDKLVLSVEPPASTSFTETGCTSCHIKTGSRIFNVCFISDILDLNMIIYLQIHVMNSFEYDLHDWLNGDEFKSIKRATVLLYVCLPKCKVLYIRCSNSSSPGAHLPKFGTVTVQ